MFNNLSTTRKLVYAGIAVFGIAIAIIAAVLLPSGEPADQQIVISQETEEIQEAEPIEVQDTFDDPEWLRAESERLDRAESLAQEMISAAEAKVSPVNRTEMINELYRQQNEFLRAQEISVLQRKITKAYEETALVIATGRIEIIERDEETAKSWETINNVLEDGR